MQLFSRGSAGRSADAHFRSSRAAWRRRVLQPLRPWLFAGLALLFIVEWRWGGHALDWSLGLQVGAIMAMAWWVYDSPPAHIERWRTGAQAERQTAKQLRGLERDGWRVVHDVRSERGNLDHVLVGPPGVFLLDSKHLTGSTSVAGDVLRVERPDDPLASYEVPRLAAGMRAGAARLGARLEALAPGRPWVQAVV